MPWWRAPGSVCAKSTTTSACAPSPPPPRSVGTIIPMKPSSPSFFTASAGKRASRSIAAAFGNSSFVANSRAVRRTSSCSAVSDRSKAARDATSVIPVHAAPGLAAEPPGRDVAAQKRRRAVLVLAEVAVHDLAHGEADVEADEVGERQRPHRMVHAEPEHRVDVLRRPDALLEREERFVDERHEDPVRDEARCVARLDGGLAEPLGDAPHERDRVVRGLHPADDLDELHQRNGVHEVHARDALRAAGRRGEPRDRDRRRVAREDRVGLARLIQLAEDLLLHRHLLERGLDREVDAAKVLDVRGGADASGDRGRLGRKLALRGELRQRGVHVALRAPELLERDVDEHHLQSGGRARLRDARAHRSAPDDADGLGLLGLHAISTATATASPPPRHSATTPRFPPVCRSVWSSVTRRRAPEAPMGWPSAIAPPRGLNFSSGIASSLRTASIPAKASLTSNESTSATSHPVFSSRRRSASAGARRNSSGSRAACACATTRASGRKRRSRARDALATTTAAAPSLSFDALPAVTVPPSLNAGLSFASASRDVSRGVSSLDTTTGAPFGWATSTGTISSSKSPRRCASSARL